MDYDTYRPSCGLHGNIHNPCGWELAGDKLPVSASEPAVQPHVQVRDAIGLSRFLTLVVKLERRRQPRSTTLAHGVTLGCAQLRARRRTGRPILEVSFVGLY